MKDEKNKPKTNENSPQETVKVPILGTVTTGFPDYKKLSEALRQDMLEASNTLTRLFDILTRMSEYDGLHAGVIIDMVKQDINKALLTLDCVDHLPDESDGNATP